jgi:hypothetical protein
MNIENAEVLRWPHEIIIMTKIKNDDSRQFHKTRLSALSKRRPSSPNTAPATIDDLQKHPRLPTC